MLFCSEPVDAAGLDPIGPEACPGERIAVTPAEVFTHHERGVREAKLPAVLERHRPGEATARNWRTVLRLSEMAEGARAPPGPGAAEEGRWRMIAVEDRRQTGSGGLSERSHR